MANRNFLNSRIYTGHVMPVMIDCTFTVTPTNGLGITNLKGPYVQNVFMHTSTTPAVGNSNPQTPGIVVTNPNPASGTILIQLQDNYNKLYAVDSDIQSALGTPVAITAASTNLTIGVAYQITTLGDATAADWLAVGVPAGITPAVGLSFIAAATGAGTGTTARVAPSITTATVASIEVLGNSDLALAPSISLQGSGAQIVLQCRDFAGAIGTPSVGSVITVKVLLSNSSVILAGE